MLKKAINHVIQVKRKYKKLDEALKKMGYGYYLVFFEKRKESRSYDVFLCFWDRNMMRKERKKAQNNSQKPTFSVLVQIGVPGAICSPWHTFRGPHTL